MKNFSGLIKNLFGLILFISIISVLYYTFIGLPEKRKEQEQIAAIAEHDKCIKVVKTSLMHLLYLMKCNQLLDRDLRK